MFFALEGSLEGGFQNLARLLPLTRLLDAARLVMIDGSGLGVIRPHLATLAAMTVVFLVLGSALFRWRFA